MPGVGLCRATSTAGECAAGRTSAGGPPATTRDAAADLTNARTAAAPAIAACFSTGTSTPRSGTTVSWARNACTNVAPTRSATSTTYFFRWFFVKTDRR